MKKTILFLTFFGLIFAQVTGSITDSDGNPIADANIVLDNGMGAASGDDGSFSSCAAPSLLTRQAAADSRRPRSFHLQAGAMRRLHRPVSASRAWTRAVPVH